MKPFLTLIFSLIFILAGKAQVSMQANLPATMVPNTEITFDVKIAKGGVSNFAKYQIDVPAGVLLSEVDNKSGSFSFDNNRGKIIWVAIPDDNEFTVKMKLNSGTATGQGVINQKFYYLDNGTKKEIEAEPITINFGGSATAAAPVSNNTTAPAVPQSQPVAKQPEPVAKTEPAKETPAQEIEKLKEKFEAVNEGPATPAASAPAPAKTTPAPAAAAPAAASTDGVTYKIQLGAYGENPGKAKYSSIKDVNIINEAGFYKVLVGNFVNKDDAVKRRAELAAQGFNGFVVAYKNGARVK